MRSNYTLYILHYTFYISFALLLAACAGQKPSEATLEAVPLRYATNLTCERGDGYSLWTLRNPWDTTQVLHRYLLVTDTPDSPSALEGAVTNNVEKSSSQTHSAPSLSGRAGEESTIIHVPVRRAGVATAVHCGLLDELGVSAAIAGVCEKEYIDLPAVTEGLAAGRIADFGNGMNPNIERIMDVAPDVLLLTPFEHSGGYGRVERLGIPIVECAEYMEVSPLARAEWIRFYGELFGQADTADSIFSAVEASYLALRYPQPSAPRSATSGDTSLAKRSAPLGPTGRSTLGERDAPHLENPQLSSLDSQQGEARPRLLTEMLYGGQWFVPCGQSTMGIMFADAGADYIFRDRPGSGSTALSFETVLDEAQDADVWLIKYNSQQPLTYSQLARDYQPYTRFRAFRERHIYACDLAHNHFYEETPFHPDRLLRDLIILLHPDRLPGETPQYYRPLQ